MYMFNVNLYIYIILYLYVYMIYRPNSIHKQNQQSTMTQRGRSFPSGAASNYQRHPPLCCLLPLVVLPVAWLGTCPHWMITWMARRRLQHTHGTYPKPLPPPVYKGNSSILVFGVPRLCSKGRWKFLRIVNDGNITGNITATSRRVMFH